MSARYAWNSAGGRVWRPTAFCERSPGTHQPQALPGGTRWPAQKRLLPRDATVHQWDRGNGAHDERRITATQHARGKRAVMPQHRGARAARAMHCRDHCAGSTRGTRGVASHKDAKIGWKRAPRAPRMAVASGARRNKVLRLWCVSFFSTRPEGTKRGLGLRGARGLRCGHLGGW